MTSSEDALPTGAANRPPVGRSLALLALLLAAVAIAAAGFAGWQLQKLQQLPDRVAAGDGRLQRLDGEFSRSAARLIADASTNAAAIGVLQQGLAKQQAAQQQLALQMQQFTERVDNFAGSAIEQRNRLLKSEAIYYLRVANAQAVLVADPQVAARALQLADEKLRSVNDPALTTVRAKLSEELAALQAIPDVDTVGISFRLQSLATQVSAWPLKNPVPERFASEGSVAELPAEGSAWKRFIATLQSVFDSIVSVRKSSAAPDVQLTAAERTMVVESVRAEVQLARLAFITGEMELFRQSLERIRQQAETYFDAESGAVSSALATLAELAAVELPGPVPDISASLSMLLSADSSPGSAQ